MILQFSFRSSWESEKYDLYLAFSKKFYKAFLQYFLLISLLSKGLLKSLLKHYSQKASILRRSAFFVVQLSPLYMTRGKTIVLARWPFVSKVMSPFFNMLSGLFIAFLPRSKHLLISWLQSPSAVILEPAKNKVCHCFHCFYLP